MLIRTPACSRAGIGFGTGFGALGGSCLWLVALLFCALAPGCGAYTMEGRVLRSSFPAIMVVPADDPRLEKGQPISGASITVIRDATTLGREQVGSATSDGDGRFILPVNGWGAGITDEEWMISAGRRGFARTESMIRLPVSSGNSRLLILLPAGTDDGGSFGSTSQDIMEEVNRFTR